MNRTVRCVVHPDHATIEAAAASRLSDLPSFIAYLRADPARTFKTRDPFCCPVANYLSDPYKAEGSDIRLAFNPGSNPSQLPPDHWAVTLGNLIDNEPISTITSARVLELLLSFTKDTP